MCKDLTDDRFIRQARRSHYLEMEPLYWTLEDAIYDNKRDIALSVYDMFLYIAAYNKEVLFKGLKPTFIDRLKSIAFELHGEGEVLVKKKDILIRGAIAPLNIPFKSEKDLNDYLCNNLEILSLAFGENVQLVGSEVKTENGYRCDLVVQGEKIYLIELKICQGTHQVVSQINKYCYYFYRKLRYDRYKKVQGVVISNGLDSWSVNEIRKDGHLCFVVTGSLNKVRLEKID